ncbi:MAG: hypothetical protein KAT14_09170 [Candidatus Marinimicrobia bacterium]|nr:hypothetical protein [Candidatus Neomarinimicrobiota bacterium]
MTQATLQTLDGLRDLSMLKWYVIPLLAIVFYIYTQEIKKARETRNWDAVLAGLTIFGLDFFNETWNGWILWISGRSACWTTPGDTGLRVMIGWNIEIIFMFMIIGIVFYNSLSESKNKKILGINEKWAIAIGYTIFCVFIECVLNKADLLVWEYALWNRTILGIWLILIFGYFIFFAGAIFVITRKTMKEKLITIGIIYAIPIIMNIIAALAGAKY